LTDGSNLKRAYPAIRQREESQRIILVYAAWTDVGCCEYPEGGYDTCILSRFLGSLKYQRGSTPSVLSSLAPFHFTQPEQTFEMIMKKVEESSKYVASPNDIPNPNPTDLGPVKPLEVLERGYSFSSLLQYRQLKRIDNFTSCLTAVLSWIAMKSLALRTIGNAIKIPNTSNWKHGAATT
jgi:hypothetical protein